MRAPVVSGHRRESTPIRTRGDMNRLTIWWAPLKGTAQAAFFDDDTPDGALLFCGGWGSGKTMTLWGKVLKLSALNAPLPLLWVVPQYSHIDEVLLPKLEEIDPETGRRWFLEPDQFSYHKSNFTLEWCAGGPILFKSAEHAESIQGQQVCAVAVDEPSAISERAWRNACARMRHPAARLRQVVCAGTANNLAWLQPYFFDADRPPRYRRYEMSTRDNAELLARDPGYVERILEHASAAEVRAFVEGHGVLLDGQPAYPDFDERVHWTPRVAPADPAAPLVLCCDFNVAPMQWCIGQKRIGTAGPEAHVLDGITQDVATTDSCCDEFLQKFPKWPAGIHVYGDCNGRNRDVRSHVSNYTIIKQR